MKKVSKDLGFCSLCGEHSKLCFDHIPPQSCGNTNDVFYYTYDQFIKDPLKKFKKKHSQNGVKYKYICENCNNLMGAKYDPELAKFRNVALDLIEGTSVSDKKIEVKNVVKSIFGHFIASAPYDIKSVLDEEMTNFYMDKPNSVLTDYSLYTLFYPHQKTIFVFKNYAVGQVLPQGIDLPKGVLSSLYFFPFAFIFMKKQKYSRGIDLIEFLNTEDRHFELKKNDWIFNNKVLGPIWPCEAGDDGSSSSFVMINDRFAASSIMKH